MAQGGGTNKDGGMFHGEIDRCRESQKAGLRHAVVCPNVTERIKVGIAQSKSVLVLVFSP